MSLAASKTYFQNDSLEYSPVSARAIASFVLSCGALLGFLVLEFAILGLFGLILGIISQKSIRIYQLRGRRFVIAGILLSLACMIGAPYWQWYQFEHEAVPGYERVDFAHVFRRETPDAAPMIAEYVGKNICLKGYAFPSSTEGFVLTCDGDYGGFCHMPKGVFVNLGEENCLEQCFGTVAVSGTLIRNPNYQANDNSQEFHLISPTVRKVKTPYDLAARSARNPC